MTTAITMIVVNCDDGLLVMLGDEEGRVLSLGEAEAV